MANTFIPKKSSVAAKVPLSTDLQVGELAVNLTDKKLYSKDASNNVVLLGKGAIDSADVTTALGFTPPSITGSGASGSWGINITGSAPWANITGKPTTLAGYGITDASPVHVVSGAVTGGAWYTIATNVGDRATARFIITDTTSGYHQSVHFIASHHFGVGNGITVLQNNSFNGGGPVRYIRIKSGGTYDGALLQVYLDATATSLKVQMTDNIQAASWVIKNFIADGTNPGGVNNFASLTIESARVDLDPASMLVNGNIYCGTATNQYRVLTTADATSAATPSTVVIRDASGNFSATTVTAALSGNASTASTLQTARNLTIGSTAKSFNGSADVSWSLAEIGALPLSGGSLTGDTIFSAGMGLPLNQYLRLNSANSGFGWGITEDGASGALIFASRSDAGAWTNKIVINTSGVITAPGLVGPVTGNATTATTLATARNLTIGSTAKSFNGSADVAWTRAEMGVPYTTSTTNVTTENTESLIGYVTNSLFGASDGALYSHVYSVNWKHQIQGDYRTGQIAIRGKNNGTWQAWRTVLDSSNYNSYAPTLTGTGASGDWAINITGSAPWANITSKPTTLAGYGITDAALHGSFSSLSSASLKSVDIRSVANPTTGIGYSSGGRFRFGHMNDADTAQGYADIIDLSTYSDSSGGGVNALYLGKGSQVIKHKYAAAGATTWTEKTIAYTDSNITGSAGSVAWSGVTSKPTTLSGYGITDAAASSHVGATGAAHGVATTSVDGFMSSTDKTKLDGIATGANNYTHPTGDGNLHVPATSTTSNGKVLVAGSTAGSMSWLTLDLSYLPDAAFKKSVKVATTAAITTSGTQTIDGVAVAVGDRVLVKDQATTSQNGIYVVSATAWSRASDADSASKIAGATVNVDSGTVNGGLRFDTDFKTTDTLGTTAMLWNLVLDSGNYSNYALALAGGTVAGIVKSTYNTASGLANGTFNVAKTVLGNYHINNGSGTTGNAYQAAITFQGGTTNESQAGIYVVNDAATGTYMGFATSNNYASGPALGMTISNAGVVNFPRARPTYAGNVILDAGNYASYTLKYNGTTALAGAFDTGTTTPTATTRLNYGGYFYPTFLNLVGSADTATAASHYFVETGSDGFVRPKTLANVKTEIVTSAAVIAGLGYTPLSNAGGAISGSISVTGDITASGAVTAYSDARLKTNVQRIENAVAKVLQLGGYTFNRVEDGSRQTGVIAQEVQQVLPEAVLEDRKGMLSVAYGNLVGILIEAIREQQAQIDELRGKIQ